MDTHKKAEETLQGKDIRKIVQQKEIQEAIHQAIDTKEDILLEPLADRRKLPNVPDSSHLRTNVDRRGTAHEESAESYVISQEKVASGRRYHVDYPVQFRIHTASGQVLKAAGRAKNLSGSGILCDIPRTYIKAVEQSAMVELSFEIKPGTMPEGYEMKINKIKALWVRTVPTAEGQPMVSCGFQFQELLAQYTHKHRQRYMLTVASVFMLFVSLFVILLRAESILYFEFNRMLYLYSILAATFLLTRYLFGAFYRPVPINPDFTPGVTVIIPCFNEEKWIRRTILSCVNQDYPPEQLEVIVIDDCSNDNSPEEIKKTIQELQEEMARGRQDTGAANEADAPSQPFRVRYHLQPQNMGKREALAVGAKLARHELLVFVDSDSFLDPFAIRNLVQPFQDETMGGVSGRTDVANTFTNNLTKMQSVRYYIAFRILKAAEGIFDAVTCLSGPLSCYRKDLVLQYSDAWLHQKFLGQKATFGDDRAMTNFILRHHRTTYQDTAICSTIVPNTYKVFLKQQMRWKRSWLRETFIAATFMWRKEPFMALSFYMGLIVPILAPVIVVYNLCYIPLAHRVFPTTFLVGILMMALLMSFCQLLLRRSSTWLYGLWFCLYYEAVLLWQMPIAWVTFWKSTWGTRMTTADVSSLLKSQKEKKKSAERKART